MSSPMTAIGFGPLWTGLLLLFAGVALAIASRVLLSVGERTLRRTTGFFPAKLSLTRKLFPATSMMLWLALVRSWWSVAESGEESLFGTLISVALIAAVGYWLARVIHVGSRVLEARYELNASEAISTRRIRTQLFFLEKLAYALLAFAVVCGSLLMFKAMRQLGASMLASAGVASIILGLAAQKFLSNLIAGIQIAFTQPMRLEDAVVVEGEWGWVEEINLTYVVLRLWDQRRLVLPITYFVEKPFQNWTRTQAQIIGHVFLSVSHAVPFAAVERELQRLLEASPLWDREHWSLHMIDTDERGVRLRALMSATDADQTFELRCYVRRGLVEFLQQHHPEALPVVRIESGSVEREDRLATGFDREGGSGAHALASK